MGVCSLCGRSAAAISESLAVCLTGSTNSRTLENFRRAAARMAERPDPPLLVASTLLVPGYVDAQEVQRIARFVAEVDVRIPYSLLGFYPHFVLGDLPPTSREQARRCLEAARAQGLATVRIGNQRLLV